MPRSDAEHKSQVALINAFRLKYPKLKSYLFAIPNGGHRHVRVAAKLKREGVMSGVSDLFFAYPVGNHSGLWIEMKTPKGRVQPSQKEFMSRMQSVGYEAKIARSAAEGLEIIDAYITGK